MRHMLHGERLLDDSESTFMIPVGTYDGLAVARHQDQGEFVVQITDDFRHTYAIPSGHVHIDQGHGRAVLFYGRDGRFPVKRGNDVNTATLEKFRNFENLIGIIIRNHDRIVFSGTKFRIKGDYIQRSSFFFCFREGPDVDVGGGPETSLCIKAKKLVRADGVIET